MGVSALCDLGFVSRLGATDIFPELCFVGVDDDDEDLVFYLNGETDCIPVDNRERPFEVFRDFFFSIQKYFSNADIRSLLDIFEESEGRDDRLSLLKMMTEAETVYLSARCYFTLERREQADLLNWINTALPTSSQLCEADLDSPQRIEDITTLLVDMFEKSNDELPLLALKILLAAHQDKAALFVVHDADEVWETPVLVDGEVVTASTEIGDGDTPMF